MDKSKGVTETERMLADFGDRTFLRLWSYANPYKDDGHEMCDLFAVFGNEVFIFFDREVTLSADESKDPAVLWDRWKRNVIDRQVKTAHGVERYIRMGRPIYLDAKKEHPFPIPIDVSKVTFHKIIVAHGAKEACERASPDNEYGSLAIAYADASEPPPAFPFMVQIDRSNPVHVFDSHNLPILLSELDTVTDFPNYLHEKIRAVGRYQGLLYCGEEDLLAHYLHNYDEDTKRHFIGVPSDSDATGLYIEEGEWAGFIETAVYQTTKVANQISYRWDELIQRTCQNSLDGVLLGDANLAQGHSAIYEMVKEPRFMRRELYKNMANAVQSFPDRKADQLMRLVRLLMSSEPDVAYLFLQLAAPDHIKKRADYREKRQAMLEIACGAAKNKFPYLVKIVGIAIDAPRYSNGVDGEDFILLSCETWTEEQRKLYEERNESLGFFRSSTLQTHHDRFSEFVQPDEASSSIAPLRAAGLPKVGRNEPCPCGSGRKFKKCHGGAGAA